MVSTSARVEWELLTLKISARRSSIKKVISRTTKFQWILPENGWDRVRKLTHSVSVKVSCPLSFSVNPSDAYQSLFWSGSIKIMGLSHHRSNRDDEKRRSRMDDTLLSASLYFLDWKCQKLHTVFIHTKKREFLWICGYPLFHKGLYLFINVLYPTGA